MTTPNDGRCPHVTGTLTQHCAEAERLASEVERLRADLAAMTDKADRCKKGLDLTISILEGMAKAESLEDVRRAIFAGMANALLLDAALKETTNEAR